MEDTTLQYNFPFEGYKSFAFSYTTGSYTSSEQVINLSISSETGLFPSNLPFKLTWFNVTDYPNIYEDPEVEIITVTGRHSSGFYITRAQEGTTGFNTINGKNYGLIQSPLSSDYEDKWKYLNNPDNGTYLFDDFDWGSSSITVLGWTSTSTAAANQTTFITQNRLGFMDYSSAGATSGAALVRLNNKLFRTDAGPLTCKMGVSARSSTPINHIYSSPCELRWGLGDTTESGALPTNGLFWRYATMSGDGLSSASGLWICSAVNSTYQYALTNYTGWEARNLGTWPYIDTKIVVEDSGNVRFYLNGSEVNGSPLTTNIPWGSGQEVGVFGQALNIESSPAFFRIALDTAEVYQGFTGQRTEPLLMTDLVSYWPLYETGGIAYDSHRSNHLTGVTSNPLGTDGVLISGRNFTQTQALWTENHNITGQGSGIGLTVFGWFNTNYTGSTTRYLTSCYDNTNNNRQWAIYSTSSTVGFSVSTNGISQNLTALSYSTGIWNFFCATYNNTTNKIKIRVNDIYSSETTNTGIYAGGIAPLCIGGTKVLGVAPQSLFSGKLSEIGIVQRPLTTGEINFLYNNSGAIMYPFNHFNET